MVRKVRIYNDNDYPFSQKFKDDVINIAPGKFVVMDRDDAVQFLGMGFPITRDYNDQVDPRSYKRLRKVPIEGNEPVAKETKVINHATGEAYDSEEAYLADLKKDPDLLERQKRANDEREVEPNVTKKRGRPAVGA